VSFSLFLGRRQVLKSDIEYWLALKFVPRLAIHKKLALVKNYGLANLFQTNKSLLSIQLTSNQLAAFQSPDWHKVSTIIEQSEHCHSKIIVFDDPLYPKLLQQIYDPPLVLFVKGNAELLNKQQIAIVGSRSASITGRDNADVFAQQLIEKDYVITSGLALGIDASAHHGALKAKGATIAVVATGLDTVYPSRHKSLAKDILQSGGAIISEFIPTTPPKAGHFPKRNRIISGLSKGVLIVEAQLRSGSLITARCALEQGREVYAIPGAIGNPMAKGCHWLIKQGAKLVDGCEDILMELDNTYSQQKNELPLQNNPQQDLFNDELLASVGYEVTPVDTVVSRSKLSTEVVLTRLTMLELKGFVVAVPGGYIRLNRG
jgi:DNA processing protein